VLPIVFLLVGSEISLAMRRASPTEVVGSKPTWRMTSGVSALAKKSPDDAGRETGCDL
jgi:hypothetical protein